jgi:hypothetical protein
MDKERGDVNSIPYVGSVVDLRAPVSFSVAIKGGGHVATHLVETLQQAHDSTLDFSLVQAAGGRVHSDGEHLVHARHDGGTGRGKRCSQNRSGRGSRGGAEESGAEHGCVGREELEGR